MQQQPLAEEVADGKVTPGPVDASIVSREEHIEYRDQHGNILDEAQIKALGSDVLFSTRYETRTRVVDAEGKIIREEVIVGDGDGDGVAPPHPDVEGRNPETKGAGESEAGAAQSQPAMAEAEVEQSPEVDAGRESLPKPGSEGNQATK